MRSFTSRKHWRVGLALAAVLSLGGRLEAQSYLPLDIGATVTGYQDDFDGTTLGASWSVSGVNVYTVSGGQLHVAPAGGDPNHLLCRLPGYDRSTQEILARRGIDAARFRQPRYALLPGLVERDGFRAVG